MRGLQPKDEELMQKPCAELLTDFHPAATTEKMSGKNSSGEWFDGFVKRSFVVPLSKGARGKHWTIEGQSEENW